MRSIASEIRPSISKRLSARSTFAKSGRIAGNFGKNTVQQSSYGKMEVSYVPIFLEISIISSLSMAMSGLSTGIVTTALLDVMLSIV